MAPSTAATARPIAVLRSPAQGSRCCWRKRARWTLPAAAARLRVSASAASSDVPDFLSSDWLESCKRKTPGPRLDFSAEEAVQYQLESLKYNDHPRQDYGIEIMYEFAEFDPFERSTYFGRLLDLGEFERFQRLFHHSAYRVLLGHKERKILSSLWIEENRFKQRIWVRGYRPGEEQIFQFTMVQRVGSWWDGYWLTESLINDGDAFSCDIAH
ncbi:hypothetical protein QOZ80_5AG0362310 [Eleusine coracana subsp. coracana]|nr:hypothetical protein QOZ80_5AG0362310 [Eleusine coracana subsp. coracana]